MKLASFNLCLVLGSSLVVGCGSDSSSTTTPDGATVSDSSVQGDAGATADVALASDLIGADGTTSADTATADTGVVSDAGPGADLGTAPDIAATDGPASAPITGRYRVTTWTCGTKDIKQTATSLGIQWTDLTFGSPAGTLDVYYSASCTRTNAITFGYPSAATITTTVGALTCTATCPANQCTPAPAGNPPEVDTFTFAASGNTVTATRPLTAEILAPVSLQKVAGCAAGETETQVLTKQ
jgi:hypothetical protein